MESDYCKQRHIYRISLFHQTAICSKLRTLKVYIGYCTFSIAYILFCNGEECSCSLLRWRITTSISFPLFLKCSTNHCCNGPSGNNDHTSTLNSPVGGRVLICTGQFFGVAPTPCQTHQFRAPPDTWHQDSFLHNPTNPHRFVSESWYIVFMTPKQ